MMLHHVILSLSTLLILYPCVNRYWMRFVNPLFLLTAQKSTHSIFKNRNNILVFKKQVVIDFVSVFYHEVFRSIDTK